MKVVICLFFAIVCAVAYARPEDEHYNTKYDNVDLDAIVKNDRLLRAYVDCLLGTKVCTKDGEELKSELNENFICNSVESKIKKKSVLSGTSFIFK